MSLNLIVAADDFGLTEGVSRGIVGCVRAGRVTAVGCMTSMPSWATSGRWLRDLDVDLGVHLTLTDFVSLGPVPSVTKDGKLPSLRWLAARAMVRCLDGAAIEREIERQVQKLADVVGRAPDYIDGHHHVHQLPVVRDAVVRVAQRHGMWVRTCWDTRDNIEARGESVLKARGLAFAAAGLRDAALAAGLTTNRGFVGAYDFGMEAPYLHRVYRWLTQLPDFSVLMCHPGDVDPELAKRDKVVATRELELEALRSAAFAALVVERGFHLTRMPRG